MQQYQTITIRRAKIQDETALADLAYRAYYDRFFNDAVTDLQGASLKVYPELIPDEEKDLGQSRNSFKEYWQAAIKNLENPEKPFLCFVAELETEQGKKIIGFRKGYATPIEEEEYKRYENENKRRALLAKKNTYRGINAYEDNRPIPLLPREQIAGSSSLYIDPEYKRGGIGRKLVQRYAKEVLKRGFKSMMTSCYIYNDSQKFIRSVGGDYAIRCNIPVTYKKPSNTSDICNIAGYMLLWSEDNLQKIANEKEADFGSKKGNAVLISSPSYRRAGR